MKSEILVPSFFRDRIQLNEFFLALEIATLSILGSSITH